MWEDRGREREREREREEKEKRVGEERGEREGGRGRAQNPQIYI